MDHFQDLLRNFVRNSCIRPEEISKGKSLKNRGGNPWRNFQVMAWTGMFSEGILRTGGNRGEFSGNLKKNFY